MLLDLKAYSLQHVGSQSLGIVSVYYVFIVIGLVCAIAMFHAVGSGFNS